MKRSLAMLFAGMAMLNAAVAAEPATLRWCNGESIPGELVEASGTAVTWKSPLFEQPLVLAWPAVHRIDQTMNAEPFTDFFTIILRDGSSLHGDLSSITADTVAIHSTRHGDAALKRSEVLSARRIHGRTLVWAGPAGDAGWKIQGPAPKDVPALLAGPGGALRFPYWNTGAQLQTPLPSMLDLEFTLSASSRPDFSLSIGDGYKLLRIETWDDELVLRKIKAFKAIRKVAESEHTISLRICCDRKAGHCLVFSPAGDLLAEWKAPGEMNFSGNDLTLANKGGDLSLDFLRIRTWDGHAPARIDPAQPRVEMADGSVLQGEIVSGTSGPCRSKPAARPPLLRMSTWIRSTPSSFRPMPRKAAYPRRLSGMRMARCFPAASLPFTMPLPWWPPLSPRNP